MQNAVVAKHTSAANDDAGVENAPTAHAGSGKHYHACGQVNLGFKGCPNFDDGGRMV
jgi:hypothetical protein